MPEEEAFCVLVQLMYEYRLRDLYKDGFDMLYVRLYQLNRLMKDQLPKLFDHFESNGYAGLYRYRYGSFFKIRFFSFFDSCMLQR